MADMSDTNLARLFIVVMAVFVPLLAAHAFLRYQTIRVQVNEDCLFCHPGWPKDLPLEVPIAMIEDVVVKRGLSGRLFGGGTLVLHLVAENKVVIADLAEPDEAKKAVLNAISNR
jgi:membrane protein YdbS with pleckstrin-like domain